MVCCIGAIALFVRTPCDREAPSAWQPYRLTTASVQAPQDHLLLGQPIDVNRADAATFEALPGIGKALALRIVADRAARGPFRAVRELARVAGIGDRLVMRLAPWLTVGEEIPGGR